MVNDINTLRVIQAYIPDRIQPGVRPNIFEQRSGENLDYKIDYSAVLKETEQIQSSEWSVNANEQLNGLDHITKTSSLFVGKVTSIFLQTEVGYGNSYIITNTIQTNQLRTFSRYFTIQCVGNLQGSPIDPPTPPESGNILSYPFAFGDASPRVITTLTDKYLISTSIDIEVVFNGINSQLRLGEDINLGRFIDTFQNNPYEATTFRTYPGIMLTGVHEIILSTVPGSGCTTGSGFILLEVS